MDFINFVFGVLGETTPMKDEEKAKLYNEIKDDMSKIVTEDADGKPLPGLKEKAVRLSRNPWFRLALAALYLPILKWIKDWYNGKFDDEEEEEDEEEVIRKMPLPGQVFNKK